MPKQTEAQIQRAVWTHYKTRRAPDTWGCAIPNGIRSNPIAIRNEKLKGFVPGSPDLIFVKNGEFFGLELKADGGRPTLAQLEQADEIRLAGGYTVIAEGLDEAIKCLETWGIIK